MVVNYTSYYSHICQILISQLFSYRLAAEDNLKMPSVVSDPCGFRDIWQSNLEEEFKNIRQIVKKYNYIAMVCSLLYVCNCNLTCYFGEAVLESYFQEYAFVFRISSFVERPRIYKYIHIDSRVCATP